MKRFNPETRTQVENYVQALLSEENVYKELLDFFSFARPDEITDYLNLVFSDFLSNNETECKDSSNMAYMHSKIVQLFYKLERCVVAKYKPGQ